MVKKRLSEQEGKPLDYFKEVQEAQKLEKSTPNRPFTALRPDMVPASQALPAEKKLSQRLNLNLAGGILIGIVIIGLIWLFLAGPGRPILEQNLASLIHKETTPTQRVEPTPLPATNTPQPSKTPYSSPTLRPPFTPIIGIGATSTSISETAIPTSSSGCRDVSTITLADVGQTLCVQGIVIEAITNPNYFMVVFSNKKGAFYWVSYDLVWSKAELDTCYQVHGTINQIGNSPILIFNYNNLPEECP